MSDLGDLGVIAPERTTLRIGGTPYEFGPLTVEQIPAFVRALAPIAPILNRALAGGVSPAALLAVLADQTAVAGIIAATSVATGIPVAVLGGLQPSPLVTLVREVIRLNPDFSIGRQLKALRSAIETPASPGAGLTPSKP